MQEELAQAVLRHHDGGSASNTAGNLHGIFAARPTHSSRFIPGCRDVQIYIAAQMFCIPRQGCRLCLGLQETALLDLAQIYVRTGAIFESLKVPGFQVRPKIVQMCDNVYLVAYVVLGLLMCCLVLTIN